MRKLAFLVVVFSIFSSVRPPVFAQSATSGKMDTMTEVTIEIIDDTQPEIDFLRFYHSDNKELNLTSLNLDDDGLIKLEPELKRFVESIGVEKLSVEHSRLKTIPFSLIGFTLTSKTLKYVSFLGNNLRSSLVSASDSVAERPKIDSLVASTITSLWGSLSPQIEQALKEHNANGSKFHYYSKIIYIDKTMPPITILDPVRAPYTKSERIKYILVRVGLFGLGVLITFVPSIIPWLTQRGSE